MSLIDACVYKAQTSFFVGHRGTVKLIISFFRGIDDYKLPDKCFELLIASLLFGKVSKPLYLTLHQNAHE